MASRPVAAVAARHKYIIEKTIVFFTALSPQAICLVLVFMLTMPKYRPLRQSNHQVEGFQCWFLKAFLLGRKLHFLILQLAN